jgi:hypothetical protein
MFFAVADRIRSIKKEIQINKWGSGEKSTSSSSFLILMNSSVLIIKTNNHKEFEHIRASERLVKKRGSVASMGFKKLSYKLCQVLL